MSKLSVHVSIYDLAPEDIRMAWSPGSSLPGILRITSDISICCAASTAYDLPDEIDKIRSEAAGLRKLAEEAIKLAENLEHRAGGGQL